MEYIRQLKVHEVYTPKEDLNPRAYLFGQLKSFKTLEEVASFIFQIQNIREDAVWGKPAQEVIDYLVTRDSLDFVN